MKAFSNQVLSETTRVAPEIVEAASLAAQSALCRATELARAGRYEQAETALEAIFAGSQKPAQARDLLARIRAQQGRLAEAQALWQEALRQDPASEACQVALRRIAAMQRRPLWVTPAAVMVALLVLVLTIGWGVRHVRSAVEGLRGEIRLKAPDVAPPAAIKIDLPGSLRREQDGTLTLTFEEGLFEVRTVLKPQALDLLSSLGRQLAPRGDAIDIDITGYTDTVPLRRGARFPDNHVLALARADAVAQHLAGCGIPTRNIAVHAAPASVTPYPNDTKENRTRNRTVEIRIAPR